MTRVNSPVLLGGVRRSAPPNLRALARATRHTVAAVMKRDREEGHGAASSDVATLPSPADPLGDRHVRAHAEAGTSAGGLVTAEGGAQRAKDQLLHDLFACPPQQTCSTESTVAVAAARQAVGPVAVGPPNGGQARGSNTPSELQFRAVHRLTRCLPPLQPAPSPAAHTHDEQCGRGAPPPSAPPPVPRRPSCAPGSPPPPRPSGC